MGAGRWGSGRPRREKLKSLKGDDRKDVVFVNATGATAQTFWLDYDGHRVAYAQIGPGSGYSQPT